MTKPIPYDDDNDTSGEEDERDMRKIVLYDDEALKLMQNWTGGQTDPLYAISSSGGWNYAWVFEDAIVNLDRDIRSVKKIGRNKYQLGKGEFSKAEIDELHTIRDALQMALDDPESVMVDEARAAPRARESSRHVADFNTLPELIKHARAEGATHTAGHGTETRIYFPRGDGQYEEATVWQKSNYWHAQGPGSRQLVRRPPRDARPIPAHAPRHAAEVDETVTANPTTKPGKHGTLYLYEIKYTDPSDEGMGELSTRMWGYNLEHVEERFYEGPDSEGWQIISIARVPEGGLMHRATRHRPMRESSVVRDYIAVDRNDRKVAGPFRSQGEASQHVPPGGHVKFSSAQNRRPPPAPSSYPIFREEDNNRFSRRRVMGKSSYWAIDSADSNELTTGIQSEIEARRIAQRYADRLGESVYLYEVGSEDEPEEISPS